MGQDAKIKNKYVKFLSSKHSKIVTLSNNHNHLLKNNYALHSHIIPWGIHLEEFPKILTNTIDILGVGALNEIKNFTLFIEVISELSKVISNLKVEIIGTGKEEELLKSLIKDKALEQIISLKGELPRNEVLNKMAKSRILLHTSSYESFGYVFIEALYSGMKIVSKNVGIACENEKWKICSTKEHFVEHCKKILEQSPKEKTRLCFSDTTSTINAYIEIYNA